MDRDVIDNVYQLIVLNKTLGDTPGFVWQIGKSYRVAGQRFECSRILHDDTAYHFNGQSRWVVFLKASTGEEFKHAYYENASLEVKRGVPEHLLV
tara:strand:- start:429 stop:713 length:285 start_codon:yes stop_codon:yes gene_type:complete